MNVVCNHLNGFAIRPSTFCTIGQLLDFENPLISDPSQPTGLPLARDHSIKWNYSTNRVLLNPSSISVTPILIDTGQIELAMQDTGRLSVNRRTRHQ